MILHAAIRLPDGTLRLGRRHAEILRDAVRASGTVPLRADEGFVTNTGEFLGREAARTHAVAAGQLAPDNTKSTLNSEDLWP